MTFNFRDFGPLGLFNIFRSDRDEYGYDEPRRRFSLIQRWRRDEDDKLIGEWSKDE